MRAIRKIKTQADRRARRHLRVRKRVRGTAARPRLVVFRSSKHIYAQVVDDDRGVTLVGASDSSEGIQIEGSGKTAKSLALGRLIAARAKEKGIAAVVFDRGGYQYHGRVKAVADGARKGGLEL
ncbi:MAG TPA: 50S ribosomal protein L18 [Gemmatimonadales bacterium]|nr:50S ribosomal protein L18 [Gemmatimonadales bacterium]